MTKFRRVIDHSGHMLRVRDEVMKELGLRDYQLVSDKTCQEILLRHLAISRAQVALDNDMDK